MPVSIRTSNPGSSTGNVNLAFEVPNMEDNSALHLMLDFFSTPDYSGVAIQSINTAIAQTGVSIFDGSDWIAFPSEGVGNPYYENKAIVSLACLLLNNTGYIRYKWFIKGSDPTITPWGYTKFPSLEITIRNGALS